jgi:hypothetical protein
VIELDLPRRVVWGRDDLMVLAAFRYCLGRQTYIVSDCVNWLLEILPRLTPPTLGILRRDLEEAYKRADDGDQYALGSQLDRSTWDRLRAALHMSEGTT